MRNIILKIVNYFERPNWADFMVACCAIAALWQLSLLWETNEIAKDTAIKQLRAYVVIDRFDILGYPGNFPMRLSIQIINSGQTPATGLTIKNAYIWLGDNKYPFNRKGQGTLVSQQKHTFISKVPESHQAKIRDKNVPLHFTGDICYEDIYGTKHKTSFNYGVLDRELVSPEGSLFIAPADDGNESD